MQVDKLVWIGELVDRIVHSRCEGITCVVSRYARRRAVISKISRRPGSRRRQIFRRNKGGGRCRWLVHRRTNVGSCRRHALTLVTATDYTRRSSGGSSQMVVFGGWCTGRGRTRARETAAHLRDVDLKFVEFVEKLAWVCRLRGSSEHLRRRNELRRVLKLVLQLGLELEHVRRRLLLHGSIGKVKSDELTASIVNL